MKRGAATFSEGEPGEAGAFLILAGRFAGRVGGTATVAVVVAWIAGAVAVAVSVAQWVYGITASDEGEASEEHAFGVLLHVLDAIYERLELRFDLSHVGYYLVLWQYCRLFKDLFSESLKQIVMLVFVAFAEWTQAGNLTFELVLRATGMAYRHNVAHGTSLIGKLPLHSLCKTLIPLHFAVGGEKPFAGFGRELAGSAFIQVAIVVDNDGVLTVGIAHVTVEYHIGVGGIASVVENSCELHGLGFHIGAIVCGWPHLLEVTLYVALKFSGEQTLEVAEYVGKRIDGVGGVVETHGYAEPPLCGLDKIAKYAVVGRTAVFADSRHIVKRTVAVK